MTVVPAASPPDAPTAPAAACAPAPVAPAAAAAADGAGLNCCCFSAEMLLLWLLLVTATEPTRAAVWLLLPLHAFVDGAGAAAAPALPVRERINLPRALLALLVLLLLRLLLLRCSV